MADGLHPMVDGIVGEDAENAPVEGRFADRMTTPPSASDDQPDAEQQEAIRSFGRPTVVLAGAGTGKTRTIVWRLVNAFDPTIVGREDLVLDSVEQVLAITFTRVAAEKLKRELREAFELEPFRSAHPEEASRIDQAWIGTIHAMALRILREQALALGIDPELRVLDDWRARALLDEAIDLAIAARTSTEVAGATVISLIDAYGVHRVHSMLAELIDTARTSVRGFRSLRRAKTEPPTARERWDVLIDLAREANGRYDAAKRTRGVVDNDDLLREAYEALERPEIRRRYEGRFRQVVVDEVQDVDSLQYHIIRRLSGRNLERLCVVGDLNQSIYGFRKANPTLIEGLLDELNLSEEAPPKNGQHDESEGRGTIIHLVNNYRSTKVITDFVNRVFGSAPEGGAALFRTYADLISCRRRVDVNVTNGEPETPPSVEEFTGSTAGLANDLPISRRRPDDAERGIVEQRADSSVEVFTGIDSEFADVDAVAVEARVIASRFRALQDDEDIPYGKMALLLGRMTEAEAYVEAFAELGIPYAFVGGSVLSRRPVPQMLLDLVRVLANPYDDPAMASVLASGLFEFGPKEFFRLTQSVGMDITYRLWDPDGPDREPDWANAKRPGWILALLLNDTGLEVHDFPKLELARFVLDRALRRMRTRPMEEVIRGVLGESGWLGRVARASKSQTIAPLADLADAEKMLRIIGRLEHEGAAGPRELAQDLAAYLEHQKDTPGFIESEDPGYVSISTIHSAKGEQFDVVAVAQAFDRQPLRGWLRPLELTTIGDSTFAALGESSKVIEDPAAIQSLSITGETSSIDVMERMEEASTEASPEDWHRIVHERRLAADREENARLDYVALTRARNRLIVCLLPREDDANLQLVNPVEERIRQLALDARDGNSHLRILSLNPMGAPSEGTRIADDASATSSSIDEEESFAMPATWKDAPDIHQPLSRRWSEGIVSHTAFVAHEKVEESSIPAAIQDYDPSSTARGSVFHELCEYAVNHRDEGSLAPPPEDVIRTLAARAAPSGEVDGLVESLRAPVARWFGSDLARAMAGHRELRAEVPFYVPLEVEGLPKPLVVNGSIDLLGYDDPQGTAWICDYKTGYTDLPIEDREKVFRHQALTYAYAALMAGFSKVHLSFLLVDVDAGSGNIEQCVFSPEEGPLWTLESVRGELLASTEPHVKGETSV